MNSPAADGEEISSSGRALRPSEVDDSPNTLVGKMVGRFRLLYPIAAGGMAQVWAAKPEGGGLSRTVAIKLVRPEYAADEEYARMFIDEAMVASSVHHPNVCEIYELGRDGDLLFMVLEWIAGDSLSGLMQRGTDLSPLGPEMAARITADACAGLHAAHEAVGPDGHALGIVHRDVSPPNILLSLHGHVKVSDFGIAKARHQLHSRTRTGEIKGKFAYIPPEQILGRGVDRRADVYAMGCVLYVASLGLRPFGSGATALGKIVQGKYTLPRTLQADYPEELEAIIVKALATKPSERYQSSEEMRLALEQWLLTRPQPVVHADIARMVRDRMNPSRRRLVEAVLSSSRALPESLAYSLLAIQPDKTHTPTATSGLVMQPPGIKKSSLAVTVKPPPKPKKTHPTDPDATLIGRQESSVSVTVPSRTSQSFVVEEDDPNGEERTRIAAPRSQDLDSCSEGGGSSLLLVEDSPPSISSNERSSVRPSPRPRGLPSESRAVPVPVSAPQLWIAVALLAMLVLTVIAMISR